MSVNQEEDQFHRIFDQLPLGATLVSPDFRFLKINKAYCDIMGYSREELMSLTFADITHPEDLEADLAQAKQLLDGEIDRYEMEKRLLRKNGEIVWIRLIVGGVRDETGRLVNFQATLEDITKKKATEEALRESEARFRTSLEILPDCFAIFKAVRDAEGRTRDFRCDYLNEAALRMAGLGRGDVIGSTLVELFPALKRSVVLGSLLQTLESGKQLVRNDVEFPEAFAIKSFSGRAFDIRAARLGDGLVVAWTDVTDRRESAEALRRKAEELETLLESVPAFVWIAHDPEGRHITGNRAADEFLRIPRKAEASLTADREERPTHFRAVKDGRVLEGSELPLQRAARGEAVTDYDYGIEFDDGAFYHLAGNAVPLMDSEGRPRGAVSAIRDITDRIRMETALRASLAEKDNLLRELSHRTKNNMQVIVALLGLQASKSEDSVLLTTLSEAQNRIRAMALVHENLYKGGSVSSLDMKGYVKDLVDLLLAAQRRGRGSVGPVLDLEEISLSLDTAMPCGLIINELVSNSLKHAFAGNRGGTLFLSLRRAGEEVELRYRDDGPGLPGELDPSRVESLGLKLVHNLAVRQLRGTMEVEPGPGGGFVFRFRDIGPVNRM